MTANSINTTLGCNSNEDLILGPDGNLIVLTGEAALQQDCVSAMKTQLGEMIFQLANGLPNFDDVWLDRNFIKWEAAARNTLLAQVGVLQVISFTYTTNTGALIYSAVLQTVYSNSLAVSGNIGGNP